MRLCNSSFCNKDCKIITLVSPDFLNINSRMKYLFRENVILFRDTYLYSKPDEIPINTRIKIIDKKSKYYNQVGEIEERTHDKYLIKLCSTH